MQVRVRKSVMEALPTPSSHFIQKFLLISFDTSSLYLLSFVLLIHVTAFSCACLFVCCYVCAACFDISEEAD